MKVLIYFGHKEQNIKCFEKKEKFNKKKVLDFCVIFLFIFFFMIIFSSLYYCEDEISGLLGWEVYL